MHCPGILSTSQYHYHHLPHHLDHSGSHDPLVAHVACTAFVASDLDISLYHPTKFVLLRQEESQQH